jgi:radical SAM superfamily enzyme YgiQ (UPF0313 family)
MVPGYRPRDAKAVADECHEWQLEYGVGYVYLWDDLAMVSAPRVEALCDALAPLGILWACNGRLDVAARHPDLLRLMAQAGCVWINYGVEAVDDHVLELMNKRLTVEQQHAGVRATLAAGISPGLNVMWGNPGDSIATLDAAVEFLLRYDDHSQLRTIRPVTPYPGSALCASLGWGAEEFYAEHRNSDLVTHDFTGIGIPAMHEALGRANLRLLRAYRDAAAARDEEDCRALYSGEADGFRGWRHT